ncbi:family 20 glycosylhydrolase [Duncaniella freteri]
MAYISIISRHFFHCRELKATFDMMTLHYMNRLHWHSYRRPGLAYGNK